MKIRAEDLNRHDALDGINARVRNIPPYTLKAIQAEGAPVGMWQIYILPAMTVFQAKNAYGSGCPWSCPSSREVEYDVDAYPAAQKHCDTHFGMTTPLRCPNDEAAAKAVGVAIRKVFENIGELEVDAISGG